MGREGRWFDVFGILRSGTVKVCQSAVVRIADLSSFFEIWIRFFFLT